MAEPRVVAEGLGFTEGPVWTRDGRLLVTSIDHGVIYEIDSDGGDGATLFATDSRRERVLAFEPGVEACRSSRSARPRMAGHEQGAARLGAAPIVL